MDNSEQIEFWNGEAGAGWVKSQEQMDRTLGPLSDLALDAAAPASGEKALDIGCGCGSTTLAIADRGATAHGIDISEPMLAHARSRATDRQDISFTCTDASAERFSNDHDLVFSRFGVMFFAEPVPAFANILSALKDSGRLVFLCWRAAAENPWITIPAGVIGKYVENPAPEDPTAPGPFALSDRDRLKRLLGDAGFTNVSIEAVDADFPVAEDLEDGIKAQTTNGPLARMFAAIPEDKQPAAIDDLRAALAPHVTQKGLVLRAAAWLVSASR